MKAITPALIVMAKPPVPGAVKTRLIGPLTPLAAARVHVAMLGCVLARWSCASREVGVEMVLAMDDADSPTLPVTAEGRWRRVPQGNGSLGRRMMRVHRALGTRRPVAFLGVDSPDVPAPAMAAVLDWLHDPPGGGVAAGSTDDGGYWTLGVSSVCPAVLRRIDWGTAVVYDQTRQAAVNARRRWTAWPAWHDVDEYPHLRALLARLADADDPHLCRLRQRLAAILTEGHPP